MQVGRFIKRLINPEPEDKGESKRDERQAGSDPPEEESSTDFIQVEGFSDSQLGEPVSASVEPDSSPEQPPSSSNEEPGPEPDPEPDQQPEPEPESEEEPRPASSLYATDTELREAGLGPDDLDQSEPEAPETNEVSEAELGLPEPDVEIPSEEEPEPGITPNIAAEEQPEETSSATPDEPEDNHPEPEPPVAAPNIDEELSLARSAVDSGFVITLATELITPISSLRASFDMLNDPEAIRNNPVESNRLVGNIERSIGILERQASDLLEVGYIHNGNLTLAKEPMLVSESVLAAIDISRSAATLRKIAIEFEMEPDLPRAIADGLRLTQIMTHLLSNAIKFAPVGGSVVISMENGYPGSSGENRQESGEGDPDKLVVRVIDHGPGIREAHFERIFEPFYRITGEGIEGGVGVGLGLAIVKGLVELHSGTVWVKSTPGETTELGFSIPLT